MKKISVLLILLCTAALSDAQLLWKISGKDLSGPSYIVGTHHMSPLSIVDSIVGLKPVLEEVRQVYGEMVMKDMYSTENMQKFQKTIMLPGDTTLHMLFDTAQYDSVAVKVKELMGADLQMLDKVKPVFLSTQIAVVSALKSIHGFDPQQQLDEWIQKEAARKGKKVGGLETFDFQMGVLYGSQSLQRQAEQLYCTVTHLKEAEQQARKLTAAYMKQDLKQVDAVMNEKMGNVCDPLPEEDDALIYNRNANWVKLMPALMKEKPTLFAVGCGHLSGKRGVLHLLKKQGYVIEPVK